MTFFLIDNSGILLEIYNPTHVVINHLNKIIIITINHDRSFFIYDVILESEKTNNSWFFKVGTATQTE